MHCSLHRSLELFEDLDDVIDAPLLLLTAPLTVLLRFCSILLLQQREDIHCLTDHFCLISNRREKNVCPTCIDLSTGSTKERESRVRRCY